MKIGLWLCRMHDVVYSILILSSIYSSGKRPLRLRLRLRLVSLLPSDCDAPLYTSSLLTLFTCSNFLVKRVVSSERSLTALSTPRRRFCCLNFKKS